ncbi:MAG: hypothetical protein OSJ39_00655 [Clostridia bacterium]|nr:hypothetical protein [Clostridia bacterium]
MNKCKGCQYYERIATGVDLHEKCIEYDDVCRKYDKILPKRNYTTTLWDKNGMPRFRTVNYDITPVKECKE